MALFSLAVWLVDAAFICCHRNISSVDRGSLDCCDLYLSFYLCFTQTRVKYICVAGLFIIICMCLSLLKWVHIVGVILSFRLNDEWVSTALSGHLHWACHNTTANTGNCCTLNISWLQRMWHCLQPVDTSFGTLAAVMNKLMLQHVTELSHLQCHALLFFTSTPLAPLHFHLPLFAVSLFHL